MTAMTPVSPSNQNASTLPRSAFAVGEQEGDEASEDDEEMDLFGPAEDASDDDDIRGDDSGGHDAGPKQEDPVEGEPHHEAQDPTVLKGPIKPSAEDIEKHNVTHLPYRSWCDVCVRAVGREDPHHRKRRKRKVTESNALPKISLDYQELKSMAKKDPGPEDVVVKIIVAKDEDSGAVLAHRVTAKGSSDTWVINKLVKEFEEMGRKDIILKTDGEPAMISLQAALQAARTGRTVLENPPQYNPQSNGACEKAVQDVGGAGAEAETGIGIPHRNGGDGGLQCHAMDDMPRCISVDEVLHRPRRHDGTGEANRTEVEDTHGRVRGGRVS